jgi:uncharacterized protein YutE (UPF0331/DUF86 family)
MLLTSAPRDGHTRAPPRGDGEERETVQVKSTTRTFDAVVEVLRDGAWHAIEDLRAATRFPSDWVDELEAEGIVDVKEGLVTMVRLRPRAVA